MLIPENAVIIFGYSLTQYLLGFCLGEGIDTVLIWEGH